MYSSQVSVRTNEGVELTARNAAVRSLDILSGATADHDSMASDNEQAILNAIRRPSILPSNVMQAVIGVKFIADHLKQQDEDDRVSTSYSCSQNNIIVSNFSDIARSR
jgi:hypothetical protein